MQGLWCFKGYKVLKYAAMDTVYCVPLLRIPKSPIKRRVKRRRGRVSQQELDALIAEVKRDSEEYVSPSPVYGKN